MAEVKPTDRFDSQFIVDELAVVCNSLGKVDENDGTYMKDRDCKACLREILKYLNVDSKKHIARCTLGAYNIVKTDLIPLLVQYCDYNEGDPELFSTILRLVTNLTSSTIILFDNKEFESKEEHQKLERKLLEGLFGFKEAFANDEKIWSVLNTHLRHNSDDEIIFERLIILIRNILHIPVNSTADMGVHPDFDTQSLCIYRMDKSGMLNTLINLASESQKGTEFCFHITEIIYLILRDQNPETLAMAKSSIFKRKLDDSDVDKRRLAELSARNRREREQNNNIALLSMQARFKRSSFVVQNMRTSCNKALVVSKPILDRASIKFDNGKTELRKSKNKKPLPSETFMQISDKNNRSSKISYNLKLFCKKFVEKVYNNYMQQIKHNLIQKKAQENDETYYLWAIHFFTSFTRHLSLNYEHISETLSTSTLHFIQILITSYQDKIKVEKKEFADTSKRLHLALRAYREILKLIQAIGSSNSDYSRPVESIKKNIFTELDYSTLLLNLLQQYSEPKHSEHYLHDLIQTNHIFLNLLEEYAQNNTLIQAEVELEDEDDDDEEIDQEDDFIEKTVADDVNKDILSEGSVHNDDDIDSPLIGDRNNSPLAGDRINSPLIGDETNSPLAGDGINSPLVGDRNNSPQTNNDKNLFLLDSDSEDPLAEKDTSDNVNGENLEKNDSEKEDVQPKKADEVEKKKRKKKKTKRKKKTDFTVQHFLTRYCHPEVIKAYLHVLQEFKSNDDSTNLAILRFFERVAFDCKNELILCQAAVFRCLLDIVKYHSALPGQDGFKTLTIHLIEVFGRMFNKRRWMFQELLFWKTHSDVLEIENAIDPPAVPPPRETMTQVADDEAMLASNEEAPASQLTSEVDHQEPATVVDSLDALRAELWDSDDVDDD